MESAIPNRLQCPRSRQRRIPDDYVPPYPGFVARHAPGISHVIMAYFGIQFRQLGDGVSEACKTLVDAFALSHGPGHWDRAQWQDERGYHNVIFAAYWDEPTRYDAWLPLHGLSWARVPRPGIGTFLEVLRPHVTRYETLLGHPTAVEGIAALADGISGPIQEHGYWGAARDRIPASQYDALHSTESPTFERDGSYVRVHAQDDLCLIRSGQDWLETEGDERRMYLDTLEPILRRGMEFLRDEGLPGGCLCSRYVTVQDVHGRATEKSYGMSWWRNLASLERWAESHPTHVAIFGAATDYFQKFGENARIKLYHEVTLSRRDEQLFEYLNCHEYTGLLRAMPR